MEAGAGRASGPSERSLREEASALCFQRSYTVLIRATVVKLFNVIQQSQATAAAAEEDVKAQRGTGKPTLPAPSLAKGKKKGQQKAVGGLSTDGGFDATFCPPAMLIVF